MDARVKSDYDIDKICKERWMKNFKEEINNFKEKSLREVSIIY